LVAVDRRRRHRGRGNGVGLVVDARSIDDVLGAIGEAIAAACTPSRCDQRHRGQCDRRRTACFHRDPFFAAGNHPADGERRCRHAAHAHTGDGIAGAEAGRDAGVARVGAGIDQRELFEACRGADPIARPACCRDRCHGTRQATKES